MSTNGRRRPRRPRIELVTPTPSRAEAEAIATAIERFVADTAVASAVTASERLSAWQRAAIREGVGTRGTLGFPWGEPPGWGP